MPEVKNTFIQSKMNKDMDGRIIPNGQYRDGQNVQISRSEGDDVGALENVLGNELLSNFGLTNSNLEIIGHLTNDTLDCIFLFLTDYTDSSPDQLSNNIAGIAGECYIIQYTFSTNSFRILVEGNFLNFSTSHPIIGVTLLESLLFWTDNRNQPRKINIDLAQTGFYTTEDQISVAKYYPYEPISLLEEVSTANGRYQSSMKDKFSPYLPIHAAARIKSVSGNDIVLDGQYTNIRSSSGVGGCGDLMSGSCVSVPSTVSGLSIDTVNNETTINLVQKQFEENDGDMPGCIVYFQRANPDEDKNWPGDPDYLKEKFVRFSYRFKFVDGEYSLSAPFTQIAFVPEQDGYFIGDNATDLDEANLPGALVGDEGRTLDSTIVSFMKNKINDIGLYIPAPTKGNNNEKYLFSQLNESLKITEIDILYKAANSNKTTIVDTLTLSNFGDFSGEYYEYEYQSRKPWKTLAPIQTTRVNDIVPVRALSQESTGNRIIYGNFIDKHTSPINLNYTLQINQKDSLPTPTSSVVNNRDYYVRKEYQNHTLKQNRTYQVGVVLSDRYGRQSNVILSSVLNPLVQDESGSTIYHRYKNSEDPMLLDKYPQDVYDPVDEAAPYTWPGDQLNAVFYSIIPELKTQDGYPGVYSVADGSVKTLQIVFSPTFAANGQWNPANNCTINNVDFLNVFDPSQNGKCNVTFDTTGKAVLAEVVSSTFNFLNGTLVQLDFSLTVTFPGCNINDSSTSGTITCRVATPVDNTLGWYSYKFVVKQTEQEYYNVYLPTTLAGYPCDVDGVEATEAAPIATPAFDYPISQQRSTSHIVLFSDNINKVPRDLQEVGPTQELYRSSERLYGRVNNIILPMTLGNSISNVGFDPGQKFDFASQVATMSRLGLGDLMSNPATPIIPTIFYNGETDPAIAVVQTNKQFGVQISGCSSGGTNPNDNSLKYGTTISVYETEPVESLLDIFWETTTSGLVTDLNEKILTEDNTIPVGITDPQLNWSEADGYNAVVSSTFEAAGATGAGLGAACSITLDSVVRGNGDVITMFMLEEQGLGTGEYLVKIKPGPNDPGGAYRPLFLCSIDDLENIYYFNFTITRNNGIDPITLVQQQVIGTCQNAVPVMREPALPQWQNIKLLANARYGNPNLTNDQVPFSQVSFFPVSDPADGDYPSPTILDYGVNSPALYNLYNRPGYGVVKAIEMPFGMMNVDSGDKVNWPDSSYSLWFEGANANCDPANDYLAPLMPMSNNMQNGQSGEFNASATTTNVTFDGNFGVYNGSYGSLPVSQGGPIFPPSNFCGDDIVWTISRMYQVSAYVDGTLNNPSQVEWFFGLGPFSNATTTGNCSPVPDNTCYIESFDPVCTFPNLDYQTCLPNSPIYWHNSADNPTPGQMEAENKVGELYNEGQHYWPDLQQGIQGQIDYLATTYPGMTLENHPAMKIQDGYNTFYQALQRANNFWGNAPSTAGGYYYYLGPLDANGYGDPLNKRFRFNIDQLPQTFTGGGFSEPIRANIFAGDKDINRSGWELNPQGSNLSYEQQALNWAQGNGLPGGRYVVTIRATDRSTGTQNFAGQFIEYDVPIWVPAMRSPINFMCSCSC